MIKEKVRVGIIGSRFAAGLHAPAYASLPHVEVVAASAIDNLEPILSVGGIDMVQFGPADYAMSIGIPGQWNDPRVKGAERYTIETALKMGIAPRVELSDFQGASPYLKMGVKHFCIGWDVAIIYKYCKEQGAAFAKALGRDTHT